MIYSIKKFIERVKPIIGYHGTSDTFAREILKKGMQPNPGTRTWKEDPQASTAQVSRTSLEGSYWTTNILTASSSATNTTDKFGGKSLFIIASIIPESGVADEDSITYGLIHSIGQAIQEAGEYLGGMNLLRSYGGLFGSREHYNDILDKASKITAEDLHSRWAINPNKKPIPYVLFYHAMDSYLMRQAVFAEKESKNLVDWKSGYSESQSYYDKIEPVWDDIPLPIELFGQPNDLENELKKAQDNLTKYYKELAIKARDEQKGDATWRILEPVTYGGRNRIISIVKYLGHTEEYHAVLELVYGEKNSQFISDWESKKGQIDWLDENPDAEVKE